MVKQAAVCTMFIDGDTFETDKGIRIRLARVRAHHVDTVEGQRAKKLLESLVLNKAITYEVVAFDGYGRSVAEVWVNSTNVNDVMISHGYK